MNENSIKFLSPSKVHLISECGYRYLLSQEERKINSNRAYSLNTFLGILMHSVLERYVSDRSKPIDLIWDEELDKMLEINERLDKNIFLYHLPYYDIKKSKFIQLLKEVNFDISGYQVVSEQLLQSDLIKGKADIVFINETEKKVKIIDLKSGPIYNLDNGEKTDIKTSYLVQLLSYGYCYWKQGFDPINISCALQGISSTEYFELKFTSDDYCSHRDHLLNTRKKLNQSIEKGGGVELANPESSMCDYCEFNFKCKPLHECLEKINDHSSLCLLKDSNAQFLDNSLTINVTNQSTKRCLQRIPENIYKKIKSSVCQKNSVLLTGLYHDSDLGISFWTNFSRHFEINLQATDCT